MFSQWHGAMEIILSSFRFTCLQTPMGSSPEQWGWSWTAKNCLGLIVLWSKLFCYQAWYINKDFFFFGGGGGGQGSIVFPIRLCVSNHLFYFPTPHLTPIFPTATLLQFLWGQFLIWSQADVQSVHIKTIFSFFSCTCCKWIFSFNLWVFCSGIGIMYKLQ